MEVLGFVRLNLGTAALLAVGRVSSAVVVVSRSWLGDGSILDDFLVFPLDGGAFSSADLITGRLGPVQTTLTLQSLVLMTFLNDVKAQVPLRSVSKVSESLCFRLFNFRTSIGSSRSFGDQALGLGVRFSQGFLLDMVVRETVGALNAPEFATHGRGGRRLLGLGLVLRGG